MKNNSLTPPSAPRADSLYMRIQRHSLELLDTVFRDSVHKNGDDLTAMIQEAGIECSRAAVYNMLNRYTLSWKISRTVESADQTETDWPDDLTERVHKLVKQHLLAALSSPDLSVKNLLEIHSVLAAEKKLELERDRLQLAEDMFQIKTGELLLKAIRANPHLFADIATDSRMTDAERIRKICERLYGKDPWGEAEAFNHDSTWKYEEARNGLQPREE